MVRREPSSRCRHVPALLSRATARLGAGRHHLVVQPLALRGAGFARLDATRASNAPRSRSLTRAVAISSFLVGGLSLPDTSTLHLLSKWKVKRRMLRPYAVHHYGGSLPGQICRWTDPSRCRAAHLPRCATRCYRRPLVRRRGVVDRWWPRAVELWRGALAYREAPR